MFAAKALTTFFICAFLDRTEGGEGPPPPSLPREVRQQVRVTTPPGLARHSKAESALPCLGRRKHRARSTRCHWVPISCCRHPARVSAAAPSILQWQVFPSHMHVGSCSAASPAIAAGQVPGRPHVAFSAPVLNAPVTAYYLLPSDKDRHAPGD